jgi:replicative DNA helicase
VSVTDDVRATQPPGGERHQRTSGDGGYERTPPQDIAAEQCVLGGMLLSKDAIADVVEIVRTADFYRPAHATVFDAILDLYGRGEPADPITVAAALADAGDLARIGGVPYLHDLVAIVPTAANAAYYGRIVAERAVLRRLVEAGTRIVQLGYGSAGGGRDVDDTVDLAQQEIYNVTEKRVSEEFAVLAELLQPTLDEIEAVGAQGGVMTGVPTGFTDLDRLLNGLHPGQLIIVAGRPGLGKALALDTPLPTPDGWTTMGAVRAGDQLIGADGRPTAVVNAFDVLHGRPCYEVEFSDGSVIVADAEHLWTTTTSAGADVPAVTTVEIAQTLRNAGGGFTHSVDTCRPLALPHRDDLPVPPQAFGVRLAGDGSSDGCIPPSYLRASEPQRRALLAGLFDTGGTGAATARFTATSRRLLDGVHELVASLGYRCSVADDTLVFETGARSIVDVRPVASVPVRCVTVDNADHLYLAGRSMIPTHNSTAAMDFSRAASVRNNLSSAIFSLEMSKVEIVMRLLSAEARVPLHILRSGQLSDDDWTKLARRMGEISEAPLFVDDTPNMTLMEVRAKARRLKQRHDLKLIIVDYLQLMTSPKRVESRQQEVAELSRGLKLLAKEVECPVVAVSQLNRGPEQRTDKRPQLSDLRESGCLPATARILRSDTNTEIEIGRLFDSGERNVPVWALNERLQYVSAEMSHAFRSGRKPVFRIHLASGKTIDATANHPFLTYDGWKSVSELVVGARLGVPRHVPPPEQPKEWPDAEVIMLAHMIGDGSFVHLQPIRYATRDEENIAAVSAAARHFGITAVREDYAAARVTTLRLPAPYRLTHRRRNPIAEWLDGLGLFGRRSHQRFLPAGVFSLPKSQVALFVRHLWATDGSVTVNRAGRSGRIYYASTSRRLLEDLSLLLLRFGIPSRLRTAAPVNHREQHTLDISGRDDQLRFLREIGVHGARSEACGRLLDVLECVRANPNVDTVPREVWTSVRRILADRGISHRDFAARMGTQFCGSAMWKRAPSRARLARIADALGEADLDLMATNDVFWDEVVEVESLGDQDVFDATVLGLHNFVANGIATHNSIEQDADVVILLHRDDYYDKESPRAGEADFIVAKHRNGPTDTITVAAQLHLSRFVDMAVV